MSYSFISHSFRDFVVLTPNATPQMSNTRCELINYLLYPLFAAVALSLALPGMDQYFPVQFC